MYRCIGKNDKQKKRDKKKKYTHNIQHLSYFPFIVINKPSLLFLFLSVFLNSRGVILSEHICPDELPKHLPFPKSFVCEKVASYLDKICCFHGTFLFPPPFFTGLSYEP